MVYGTGTVVGAAGPIPEVERTAAGTYSLSISGLGSGCILPQLTPVAHDLTVTFGGGFCAAGHVTTTVSVQGGVDAAWAYLMVGVPADPGARVAPSARIPFPTSAS
jgi:hypothetical protein